MTEPTPKKSDLGIRSASAIVMVAVAGTALWLGGWVWTLFVAAVALGVLREWRGLAKAMAPNGWEPWMIGGGVYVGLAAATLWALRNLEDGGLTFVLYVLVAVIATDVGAYFFGRTFGGAKIAPSISPSKTWAGLLGAMVVVPFALWALLLIHAHQNPHTSVAVGPFAFLVGPLFAIVAQAGDFFESWMKRRAGVKDSGNLIPGHGGLFDRVDGLLAVCFVIGLIALPSLL